MPSLPYEYTDKMITPWGGLRLIEEFWTKIGFRSQFRELPWDEPGSGRGYEHFEIAESFLVSVILGAQRFSEASYLGVDEVIQEIFSWDKGMPNQSTLSRFFPKYTEEKADKLFIELMSWWFKRTATEQITLDFDSTVITRYGQQDGVEVGYNPKKQGRGSHHPIMAFIPDLKMVVNSWMRTGDSSAADCFHEFFDQTLEILPRERIGMVRADSGFSGNKNLCYLEDRKLDYIIAMRMTSGLVAKILDNQIWMPIKDGISSTTIWFKAKGWKAERRIVVVRKDTEKLPKSGGKTLFSHQDDYLRYRYSAFATNCKLSDDLVWEIYKHRAEAENQIKELKYDYGIEGFAAKNMDATEFAFRLNMVAYNLMSLYKLMLVNTKSSLSAVRYNCIAIGAYLVKHSRKQRLKLAVRQEKQDYIDGLFKKLTLIEHDQPWSIA